MYLWGNGQFCRLRNVAPSTFRALAQPLRVVFVANFFRRDLYNAVHPSSPTQRRKTARKTRLLYQSHRPRTGVAHSRTERDVRQNDPAPRGRGTREKTPSKFAKSEENTMTPSESETPPSGFPHWCHFCGADRRANPSLIFRVVPLSFNAGQALYCGKFLCAYGKLFNFDTQPAYCVGKKGLFSTLETKRSYASRMNHNLGNQKI